MLNNSRLYVFIDQKSGYSIRFLEGQKILSDIAIQQGVPPKSFLFYRSTILSFLPLISFLKNGESLGVYLDSEDPYFRFKFETNYRGHTRVLLLPEDLNTLPLQITGQARVSKQFAQKDPYTSIIEFYQLPLAQISNRILFESYQTQSQVFVSDNSDQSFLISQLPIFSAGVQVSIERETLQSYIEFYFNKIEKICSNAYNKDEDIIKSFEDLGLTYLSSTAVQFFCPCSFDYYHQKLLSVYSTNIDAMFENEPQIEVKCDYCKKQYIYLPDNFKKH